MPYTPGVDEAVMSRYAVLTPAAWQDFAAYVQQLEAGGHHGRARTLASSVVGIRHAGHGLPGGSAGVLRPSWSLPPIPWVPCREEGCLRCREGRGGFRFPWIGVWSRRHCVTMPGATAAQAWIAYHGSPSPMERLSLEWLALPAAEARPLLIRYNEHIDLRQLGPGAPLCVAIGCLERAPFKCRQCRAPLCGECAARGCELCGQPGSSSRLRVGHGAQPGSGAVRGRGRR